MAPEVIKCEPYNEKCDVYSFGVILNELITGDHPYIEIDFGPAKVHFDKTKRTASSSSYTINRPYERLTPFPRKKIKTIGGDNWFFYEHHRRCEIERSSHAQNLSSAITLNCCGRPICWTRNYAKQSQSSCCWLVVVVIIKRFYKRATCFHLKVWTIKY